MLAESKEKFFLTTKFSTDLLWEWDLAIGEISVSNNIEELFGYTLKNKKGKATDWIHHVHPEDKEELDKSLHTAVVSSANNWEHDFRFIRADGSIVHVLGRAGITRHPNGKATRLTGALQDLSKQKELEEKLARGIADREKLLIENEKNFKLIFNSSSDVLFDIDLVANKVVLSDAYEKEFGYKIINNITSKEDVFSHIHPCDKEALMQDYSRMLASEDAEWKYKFRFLRADDSVANLLSSGIVLRDADGKAVRRIGHLEDISKHKVLEERLEQEIKLKEKQIVEAAEEARKIERSDLGKELHDNVNQLLGASRLYLSMVKGVGENSEMYLSRSSEYTLMAIEEIRKLSKGLTTDLTKNLGLLESIENLTRDTMEVNPIKISCVLDSYIENRVNDQFRKNVFRIVQEQMNNILKHAKATEVTISLSQKNKFIILSISDNGVGFDTGKKQKGIGIANIKSRAVSYNGTADFISQPGRGCVLVVTFPVTDALLNTFSNA